MFAYLLIGIELAILYGVFWYVFVREPRPYTLQGHMWGTYDTSNRNIQQSDVDTLVLEYKEKAASSMNFDRRIPRPAYPTPTSSAYDPSLCTMPARERNTVDPRDPYLDFPQASENLTFNYRSDYAPQHYENGYLARLIRWLNNISVKLP